MNLLKQPKYSSKERSGLAYAIGSALIWVLFPVYWKLLRSVTATQLTCHRIFWSFVILLVIILASHQWRELRAAIMSWRSLRLYVLSAVLIGSNWVIYVWAVNANHITEASLGYFISPLITICLGLFVLHEHMRSIQKIAAGAIAAGVLYLTFAHGAFPWLALVLALTFGIYGAVKKIAPLNSLHGLTLEMGILFLPATIYLLYLKTTGENVFFHANPITILMLIGTGVLTATTLLMFATATRRVNLSVFGFIQYITPTLQFFLGILAYKEPFTHNQVIGFGIIWVAMVVFALDEFFFKRKLNAT